MKINQTILFILNVEFDVVLGITANVPHTPEEPNEVNEML
jgi:hypothetical protein